MSQIGGANLSATLSEGFITIPEFINEELPQNTPIAGPLSAGELAIIASPTGFGKTWLALGLTHGMLTGQDFLYFDNNEARSVLHIDGEMHAAKLQSRLKCFSWVKLETPYIKGLGCQHTFRKAGLDRLNLADPVHQAAVIDAAQYFDVIVLDNVYSLVNVEGQSMSSDQFWVQVMNLNLALRDMNKLVIWFDHTNTAGQVFGTKTKEWQVDYVGLMSRKLMPEKKKLSFMLEWTKHRDLEEYPKAISVEMTTDNPAGQCEWTWKEVITTDELAEVVIEALENGRTYAEICHTYNVSKREVSKIKKEYGIK